MNNKLIYVIILILCSFVVFCKKGKNNPNEVAYQLEPEETIDLCLKFSKDDSFRENKVGERGRIATSPSAPKGWGKLEIKMGSQPFRPYGNRSLGISIFGETINGEDGMITRDHKIIFRGESKIDLYLQLGAMQSGDRQPLILDQVVIPAGKVNYVINVYNLCLMKDSYLGSSAGVGP